jgi:hypothetical protein
MKGDFSRFTFDPNKGYTGVYMQQGRVQLDADWNEQIAILLHQLRTRFEDLVGSGQVASGAGPVGRAGFEIRLTGEAAGGEKDSDQQPPGVEVGPGRYYVDGLLCENRQAIPFDRQPDAPGAALPAAPEPGVDCLLYLDAWQQHVTSDDDPGLREPALGELDTTTRTRTAWQVRWLPCQSGNDSGTLPAEWMDLSARWQPSSMGLDNQLYRVEVHSVDDDGRATFKWSRENGAVQFPISRLDLTTGKAGDERLIAEVERLHDLARLSAGDWVEIVDATPARNGQPRPLCQVLDRPEPAGALTRVTLSVPPALRSDALLQIEGPELQQPRARLCRWDHDPGAVVPSDVAPGTWLPLERGIEIRFEAGGHYRSGDYWLIPTRSTGTAPLLWPDDGDGQPLPIPPHGVDHHLAPLALLTFEAGAWSVACDLRATFAPLLRETAAQDSLELDLVRLGSELEALQRRIEDPAGVFETYESLHRLDRGDVVALDPASRRVVPANHENEALVIGVVVAAHEHGGLSHCKVVHYGRAVCKVDGEVEPGDVLVPSKVDGAATRAGLYVQPGTVVGKALAANRPSCDPGEIEIMVTLR